MNPCPTCRAEALLRDLLREFTGHTGSSFLPFAAAGTAHSFPTRDMMGTVPLDTPQPPALTPGLERDRCRRRNTARRPRRTLLRTPG